MRNQVTTTPISSPHVPTYQTIAVGQMFRYWSPWDEQNIYMKTNNPDYCIHINTGTLYTVKPDRQIVPLKPCEVVTISTSV